MNAFKKELETFYAKLPVINCLRCANCCRKLRPSFGITEFVYFMSRLFENKSKDEIVDSANKKTRSPGCVFLGAEGTCSVHQYRPFACRVFGVRVSHEGSIINEYHDDYADKGKNVPIGPVVTLKEVNLLNKELDDINRKVFPIEPPYWISGLTFESWLSLYMDDGLRDGRLRKLRSILREHIDLGFLEGRYRDNVGIARDLEDFHKSQRLFDEKRYREAFMGFFTCKRDVLDDYATQERRFYCAMCLEILGNPDEARRIYESVFIKTVYRDDVLAKKASEKLQCLAKNKR